MYKIKIGIPRSSVYLNLYKIYFDKLGFDVIESSNNIGNNYIERLYNNIEDLKNKCDYIIFPKYKNQNIIKKNNCNFIIHEVDKDYDNFIYDVSDKFYIDEKISKLAYDESVTTSLIK